jgi:hypothetical protein
MIQPIGRNPYAAPKTAVASTVEIGMPNTNAETATAATRPASAATCARHCSTPSATSSSTIGTAAAAVLSHGLPSGS